ncbi:hypothetical protein BDQ17DRAFT_1364039 [Cyathus striatus]|nr:hypothetical protein BDQ17DRAFT_1364039 [Cyathus striatus]
MKDPSRENTFLDISWASCTQPYFFNTESLEGSSRRASWDASKISEYQGVAGSRITRLGEASDSAFGAGSRLDDRSWSEPPQRYNPSPPFPFRQSLTPSGHPDWGTAPTPKGAKHRAQSRSHSQSTPIPASRLPRNSSSPQGHQNPHQCQNKQVSQNLVAQGVEHRFRSTRMGMTDLQGPLMGYRNVDQTGVATNNHSCDIDNEEELLRSIGASLDAEDGRFREIPLSTPRLGAGFGLSKDIPVTFPHERSNFMHVDPLPQEWPMTL